VTKLLKVLKKHLGLNGERFEIQMEEKLGRMLLSVLLEKELKNNYFFVDDRLSAISK